MMTMTNGDDYDDDNKILLVQMTNVLWGSLSIGPHPPQESQESIYRLAISGVGVTTGLHHQFKRVSGVQHRSAKSKNPPQVSQGEVRIREE